jgi:hypothetical protein
MNRSMVLQLNLPQWYSLSHLRGFARPRLRRTLSTTLTLNLRKVNTVYNSNHQNVHLVKWYIFDWKLLKAPTFYPLDYRMLQFHRILLRSVRIVMYKIHHLFDKASIESPGSHSSIRLYEITGQNHMLHSSGELSKIHRSQRCRMLSRWWFHWSRHQCWPKIGCPA